MQRILFAEFPPPPPPAAVPLARPQVPTLVLQPLQPRVDRLAGLYERLWRGGYAVRTPPLPSSGRAQSASLHPSRPSLLLLRLPRQVREERFVAGAAPHGLPSLTLRVERRPLAAAAAAQEGEGAAEATRSERGGERGGGDGSRPFAPPLLGPRLGHVVADDEAAYLAFLSAQRDAIRAEIAGRRRAQGAAAAAAAARGGEDEVRQRWLATLDEYVS